jgi:hypothetical protein
MSINHVTQSFGQTPVLQVILGVTSLTYTLQLSVHLKSIPLILLLLAEDCGHLSRESRAFQVNIELISLHSGSVDEELP